MKKTFVAAAAAVLLAASFQINAQQNAPAESRTRADALFTQEERDQFREKMRAAQTREERAQINKEMRAAAEQRAKEKGITLPQRRAAGHHRGHHGPQLLSAEERNQYRDRMRAATTPEERATLRKDMRAAMEQRAREKGVTAPHGHNRHHSARNKEGSRPQLFTPEERQQYRDKMRAATTPEERATLRQQTRELAEQRARDRGVTLPKRRGRGEPAPAA